jgi:tetratricopeptide (TPR) repeat protein
MGSLALSSGSLFVDRFQVTGAAGSGGMGTVYRAFDLQTGKHVALKILRPQPSLMGQEGRFQSEAQVLSELRHPAIVAYVTHGIAPGGERYLAMEWLDGEDLGQRLQRGPLSFPECISCIQRVADALHYAHQRGVIHRDLKPANLFLPGGDVRQTKLLDFGIARRFSPMSMGRSLAADLQRSPTMTQTGFVVGTPEYMAPEQVRGSRDLLPAADLFSLGCVLYECLTGQPPFAGNDYTAVLARILFSEPEPLALRRPGLPPGLVDLVERLLQKEPSARPADVGQVCRELAAIGEAAESAMAATEVFSAPQWAGFAIEEQGLFSIVIAAEISGPQASGLEEGVAATQEGRRSLFQALAELGVRPDALADRSLIVTVPVSGSAQDQVRRAARAALLIKEQWPQSTVSLATGQGSIRKGATVGEVVDLATRPMRDRQASERAASAQAVFIDGLSAKLLDGRFEICSHNGIGLLRSSERDVDVSRPLLGKPTPCVGREVELAYLETRLAVCVEEAQAHAVLVTGPPGMGKSRLRHELLRRLDKQNQPWVRLLARADLGGASAPYEMLGHALRRLCAISGDEPPAQQRERLQARVSQHLPPADRERVTIFLSELCKLPWDEAGIPMLAGARQQPPIMRDRVRRAFLDWIAAECKVAPVLIVLDDLQWSDELTVRLLHEALHEQKDESLCVLAFARPEVSTAFPKLWVGCQLQELPLKELSRRACERLLRQVLGDDTPPRVIAETVDLSRGNALFLEELIRARADGGAEERPETVLAMLQSRLTRLESGTRRLILAASIFGESFGREGLAAVLELPPDAQLLSTALEALQRAELIQPAQPSTTSGDSGFAFRHALVKDAAYALLSPSDRATGHRLAAEYLTRSGTTEAAIIAKHFEHGGERERAAAYYWQAAERCFLQCDYRGALRQSEAGSRLSQDRELLARLASVECAIAYRTGRFSEGHAARAIFALAALRPGSIAWSRAAAGAITTLLILQKPKQAADWFAQVLRTEPDPDGRVAYIDSLSYLTSWSALGAARRLVEALLARLHAMVDLTTPTTPTVRYYLEGSLAQVALYRWGRPAMAIRHGEMCARLAHDSADPMAEFHVRCHIIELSRLELGDVTGVIGRMLGQHAQIFSTQEAGLTTLYRQVLSRALCASPDVEAWQAAIELTAPFLKVRNLAFFAQAIAARVALQRGDAQAALPLITQAMAGFVMVPFYLLDLAVTQIRCLHALGRSGEAVAAAEAALAALGQRKDLGPFEVEFHLATSEAFRAAGQDEHAVAALRLALEQMQVRLDDVSEPERRQLYLRNNPHCQRVLQLASDCGIDVQALPAVASSAPS